MPHHIHHILTPHYTSDRAKLHDCFQDPAITLRPFACLRYRGLVEVAKRHATARYSQPDTSYGIQPPNTEPGTSPPENQPAMRERITFVHEDPSFDPDALDLQDAGLLGPQIETARQNRLTINFDELPQELADFLKGFEALHVRWASPLQYTTLDPFSARLSPGLHLSYSPSQSHENDPYVTLITQIRLQPSGGLPSLTHGAEPSCASGCRDLGLWHV